MTRRPPRGEPPGPGRCHGDRGAAAHGRGDGGRDLLLASAWAWLGVEGDQQEPLSQGRHGVLFGWRTRGGGRPSSLLALAGGHSVSSSARVSNSRFHWAPTVWGTLPCPRPGIRECRPAGGPGTPGELAQLVGGEGAVAADEPGGGRRAPRRWPRWRWGPGRSARWRGYGAGRAAAGESPGRRRPRSDGPGGGRRRPGAAGGTRGRTSHQPAPEVDHHRAAAQGGQVDLAAVQAGQAQGRGLVPGGRSGRRGEDDVTGFSRVADRPGRAGPLLRQITATTTSTTRISSRPDRFGPGGAGEGGGGACSGGAGAAMSRPTGSRGGTRCRPGRPGARWRRAGR